MKAEIQAAVKDITASLDLFKQSMDWDVSVKKMAELTTQSQSVEFWNNAKKAQSIMRQKSDLERQITSYNTLKDTLNDSVELLEMAEEEKDEELIAEAENSIVLLKETARKIELEALLSGQADGNNCFMEINAGAGGTESCDWVAMILRMYQRWADSRGFKCETIEYTSGEEAGVKSVTVQIKGAFAYGWSKTESGVHRLVRISPFDSSSRRHTSFASVVVYPEIDDDIDIVIEDKDIKVDTYRASGAGGQHVNTTDSAVRMTHLPTNTVVQCQNQRSQHKNREEAMKMLKAKLFEIEMQKREQEASEAHAQKTSNGWGHQIRSYVLHPYQMVKDLRTGVEKGNAQGVLDGDLDDYLQASLALRAGTLKVGEISDTE